MKFGTDIDKIDLETERSLSRMNYGHEIWAEGFKLDNGIFSILGMYGHKLAPDRPMPEAYTNATVYDDDGPIDTPKVELDNDANGWRFTFGDTGADVYTFYIDSDSCWVTDDEGWHRGVKRDFGKVKTARAFHMTAKKIFSRNKKDVGEVRHSVLEIVPSAATLNKGAKTEIDIIYEGRPLVNQKVVVYCKGWQDVLSMNTDSNGRIRFDVTDAGTYIIIAKYTDETKCSEDEFDETVFSTTLTIEAE